MDSMDDRLHAMIAKVEDGSEFALVLAPSANSLDIRAARAIIRKISTLGGDALAFHELYAGKTGSGIYGTSDEIVDVSRRTGKRFLESRLFRTFYSDKEFRWTFVREIDVPASLVV
ncbi:hypothetical protein G6L37_34605 [Agrobacterium rubi]|nr:hypothetical protein [Agrobacterium rubi]NTF23699.1 hypothetical protein [Agrobacterium rubi]